MARLRLFLPLIVALALAAPALAEDPANVAVPAPAAIDTAAPTTLGYGMNLFTWGWPGATQRDLSKLVDAGIGWQKSLFQWRLIERSRGIYDWTDADRLVRSSNDAGIRVVARVDFPPAWARADRSTIGPPDRYEDYGDFVYALARHFAPGSPHGTIAAIEFWNEPNIAREWGGAPIGPRSAADYVRLLCIGNAAAKRASPSITSISAGLTPTGTLDATAADERFYLQWMYEAGAAPCFDVLGAHGAGFKAPPWISPDDLANDPQWGGNAAFGFRRVEQVREVMVKNGDAAKQIWLTEFGWTSDPIHDSYAWHRVTEDEKAQYFVEAYRWAYDHWQPWIGVMLGWTFAAPDWDQSREEFWWSVTNPDGTNRPAFDSLRLARRSGYLPPQLVATPLPTPTPTRAPLLPTVRSRR